MSRATRSRSYKAEGSVIDRAGRRREQPTSRGLVSIRKASYRLSRAARRLGSTDPARTGWGDRSRGGASRSAIRGGGAVAQRYLVTHYFLGVVVQFFLVGYGLFAMKKGNTIDDAHSLSAHRDFGWALTQYGGLLLLLATPSPRRSRCGSGLSPTSSFASSGSRSSPCWRQAESTTGSWACSTR
jgi:hypothetical protein